MSLPLESARLRAIPRARLGELIAGAPKAELHLHIEGTLEPELIFALAERHGRALPYADVEALRAAYAFTDLQSFLDLYYAGAGVLIDAEDFEAMAMAYFRRAAADGVMRAEIFFDPQTHTERGVAFATVMQGLLAAARRAERELGLSVGLIMCFLRHLSEEAAFATLHEAKPWREQILGVGLDSSERGHPPVKFERVFAACRELGWRVVAHAGEEGPAEYVWQALDVLKAERVDHGVRSVDDAVLMRRLAAERVPLTVCPLSNVRLRVFANLAQHNLPVLLDAGLCATINSDDPAYFGGYLNANFVQTFDALPRLNAAHAYALIRNGFEASFMDAHAKAHALARVDAHFLSYTSTA